MKCKKLTKNKATKGKKLTHRNKRNVVKKYKRTIKQKSKRVLKGGLRSFVQGRKTAPASSSKSKRSTSNRRIHQPDLARSTEPVAAATQHRKLLKTPPPRLRVGGAITPAPVSPPVPIGRAPSPVKVDEPDVGLDPDTISKIQIGLTNGGEINYTIAWNAAGGAPPSNQDIQMRWEDREFSVNVEPESDTWIDIEDEKFAKTARGIEITVVDPGQVMYKIYPPLIETDQGWKWGVSSEDNAELLDIDGDAPLQTGKITMKTDDDSSSSSSSEEEEEEEEEEEFVDSGDDDPPLEDSSEDSGGEEDLWRASARLEDQLAAAEEAKRLADAGDDAAAAAQAEVGAREAKMNTERDCLWGDNGNFTAENYADKLYAFMGDMGTNYVPPLANEGWFADHQGEVIATHIWDCWEKILQLYGEEDDSQWYKYCKYVWCTETGVQTEAIVIGASLNKRVDDFEYIVCRGMTIGMGGGGVPSFTPDIGRVIGRHIGWSPDEEEPVVDEWRLARLRWLPA